MKSITLYMLLLVILFVSFATAPLNARVSFEPICGVSTDTILKNLAKFELPQEKIFNAFPIAGNDVMCGTDEHMLNIAIIATIEPGKYFYGIFHVHFSQTGEIISSAPVLPMKKLSDLDDPFITNKWCDFIRIVYPKELGKQGC